MKTDAKIEISRETYEKSSKVRTYESIKEILTSVSNRPSNEEIKKEYLFYTQKK